MSILKTCPRCKQEKSIDCFNRCTKRKDGRQAYCRVCTREISKERWPRDREKIRDKRAAYDEIYRSTLTGKDARKRAGDARKQREKGGKKDKARDAIKNQWRKGIIPHPKELDCLRCGDRAQSYHHYLGYEKKHRLDVIPLCTPCHVFIDTAKRDAKRS